MYGRTNRVHVIVYIIYAMTTAIVRTGQAASFEDVVADELLGAYIFFSLYYAFVFPLIGLSKSSISINLLTAIQLLQARTGNATRAEVTRHMAENKLGTQDLRESRLYQLTYLGFATSINGSYRCTGFGKAIHKLASAVLAVWNQRRL